MVERAKAVVLELGAEGMGYALVAKRLISGLKPAFYQLVRILDELREALSGEACEHVTDSHVEPAVQLPLQPFLYGLVQGEVDEAVCDRAVEAR